MKRTATLALPLAAVAAAGLDEAATADLFLKLPNVDGESTDTVHKGEIDVLAWSWGVTQSGTFHSGGGGAGKASFGDIKVIKSVDAATPALLGAAATGSHFDEAWLTATRPVKSGTVDYLTIHLTNVLVTKVADGGKAEDQGVAETVTLNFGKIEYEYLKLDVEGKTLSKHKFCFDAQAYTSC